jgi:hypothetical protein
MPENHVLHLNLSHMDSKPVDLGYCQSEVRYRISEEQRSTFSESPLEFI